MSSASDDEMPDAHLSAHISLSAPPDDPELHNVVTDFVDYTEYFPSDMIRSLTLIRSLDERYQDATQAVHEYALLLGKPTQDAADLRRKMSKALQQATIYREAACAEANRLAESAERNQKRIGLIRRKLAAMPLPPSRDPTPVPVSSPLATRGREKVEKTPKLTLHVDGDKQGRRSLKHRRVVTPGEVLPPPSASDGAYTQTEESSGDEGDDTHEVVVIESRGRKTHKIKIKRPQTLTGRTSKTPKTLKVRMPGMGTNVHSQVAGISTSNALALLPKPPADARPGSKHKPWFKLTEYEMAYLRKNMKKNAVWTPSDTMIRRYLRENQRGPEFYEKAKLEAEENGEELLDEDPTDPDKTELAPGEIASTVPSGQSEALENRGMRLNVAKREKAMARKEAEAKEAAEAAAAARIETATAVETIEEVVEPSTTKKKAKDKKEKASAKKEKTPARPRGKKDNLKSAIRSIDDLGLGDLFTSSATPIHESITIILPGKKSAKSSKKRKREPEKDTPGPSTESPAAKDTPVQPGPKRLKINQPALAPKPSSKSKEPASPSKTTTVTTTTQVPLAPAGASPTKAASKKEKGAEPAANSPVDLRGLPIIPTAAQSRPRRVSGSVKTSVETSAEDSPSTTTTTTTSKEKEKEVKIAEEPATTSAKEKELRPRSRGSLSAMMQTQSSKAASAEPPSRPARDLREKRRASVVEAHPASDSAATSSAGSNGVVNTAAQPRATRANRRPAPGFVTAAEDGKGKVSVGKRKAAPKKGGARTSTSGKENEVVEEGEAIDPDEPRYCVCGDVSWGTMVACENGECEREWFHLDCVDLKEPPTRRQMWYCPECREKMGIHANGDPLVVGSIRTR